MSIKWWKWLWVRCDTIFLAIKEKIISFLSSLISLPNETCRFMHIFILNCRFASLIVDVHFHHKTIVDCRQKGQKSCALHLIRTPLTPHIIQCIEYRSVPNTMHMLHYIENNAKNTINKTQCRIQCIEYWSRLKPNWALGIGRG